MKTRTKNTFKPAVIVDGGQGDTVNDDIADGFVPLSAASDKYTLDAVNAANPLNNPTPFTNVPEVVEGSET